MNHSAKHPFYGSDIFRDREQQYIEKILKRYKGEPVNDALKKKIWEKLQVEKHLGNIKIPFEVVLHRDPSGKFPEYIEVILDSMV